MKRSLSILLALVMCLSSLGFATNAFAADASQCVTVTFAGTENNSAIDDVANAINDVRTAAGYSVLSLDSDLTAKAKQRAKELFVYYDSQDSLLPSGDSVTAYMPGAAAELYRFYSVPTYDNVKSYVSDTAKAVGNNVNGLGIGIFTVDGHTSVYIAYSVTPTTTLYQDFTDAAVTASVYTLTSNISKLRVSGEVSSNGNYYNLSTLAYFNNGIFSQGITISNDLVTYKSSKPSVAKVVKGTKLYPKDNGKYSITVTFKANAAVKGTETGLQIYGLSRPKVTIKSAKSSKKKKLTVKWNNNVSNATGYEVQYSTSKKFTKKTTKTVTVKGKKSKSKTISKLKSKKTYYVRVRAYKNQGDGERFYGKWSSVKTVKVK